MSAGESVVASIQHYQKSIQKYHGNSSRIRHCIDKLYKLPVKTQHLQATGIGKTINSLRKSDGEVGEAARALVAKWKQMVEEEDENEQQNHSKEEAQLSHNEESGMERLKHNRDRQDKTEDSSRSSGRKEQAKVDHGKSQKRKKEFEYDHHKEKRHKNEDMDGLSNPHSSSVSDMRRGTNGKNVDVCSDEEWKGDEYHDSGDNNEDDRDTRIKMGRDSSEERYVPSSGDELDKSGYITASSDKESWHRKTNEENDRHDKSDKTERNSSHKSKSSSSSSEKNKHSSSNRTEEKDRTSSSGSRHKSEKSSFSGSGSGSKKTSSSEDKSKNKEKEKKDKHKDKHRSKEEKKPKDKKKDKEKKKVETEEDGVDSFSGKSFGEALGMSMMFAPDKSRKKSSQGSTSLSSPSTSKSSKSSSTPYEKKTPIKNFINSASELERECASLPLQPLEVDEDFGLPALNPNYKPLPQPNFYNSPPKRYQNDDDDLTNIMYSKVQRTKVFSGNRSGYTSVPSLFDLCTRVLQENIDALEYTGGVPFDLLKPVLERATPDQLFTLEDYNAYLIEDTDVLWEFHCKKDFRNKKREELETWREMYLRCREERENKLKSLTANIAAASKAKALPVRKTQLAYIDCAKPPRNIARKQAKFGTAHPSTSSLPQRQESSGSSGLSTSFTGRSSSALPSAPAVSVPAPRGAGGNAQSSSCKPKPKAPLMQKALQLIKYNRFKR